MTNAIAEISGLYRAAGLIVFSAIALFVQMVPASHGAAGTPMPLLFFIVLSVFAMGRDVNAAPLWLTFPLCLIHDAIAEVPPGITALSMLIAVGILRKRAFIAPHTRFLWDWVAYCSLSLAVLFIPWFAMVLTFAPVGPVGDLIRSWGAGIMVFPFIAVPLRRLFDLGPRSLRDSLGGGR